MIETQRKPSLVVYEALLAVVFGALLAAALTAFVSAAWPTLYAPFPWPGYAKTGNIHDFTSSPRAMRHAMIAFAAGGALVGCFSRSTSFSSALLAWCSLWVGLLVAFNLS